MTPPELSLSTVPVSTLVTVIKGLVVTVVNALSLSFPKLGSGVCEDVIAVFWIEVPPATETPTFTPSVKLADAPEARLAAVQEIEPLELIAGVVHDQPAGETRDWKTTCAGKASSRVMFVATVGPLLATTME